MSDAADYPAVPEGARFEIGSSRKLRDGCLPSVVNPAGFSTTSVNFLAALLYLPVERSVAVIREAGTARDQRGAAVRK